MQISFIVDQDCIEFLPSIMLQRCLGRWFLYICWLNFGVEISGPDDEYVE